MALTTKTNAKKQLNISATTYDTFIDNLLVPVTDIIEKYCDRIFGVADYKIWVKGYGGKSLYLPQYPINSVSRVAIDKVEVATIECQVSGATKAYVTITSTGMALRYIDSNGASQSETTLVFSTYKNLTTLAAAMPTGWVMTINDDDYNTYPTLDLIPIQSAPCMDGLDDEYTLEMPNDEIVVKLGDFENGEIESVDEDFPDGRKLIYVEYNAGYTEPVDEGAAGNVPEALENIAIQMIWNGIEGMKSDRNMASEKMGDYAYTRRDVEVFLTPEIKAALYPFCKPSI